MSFKIYSVIKTEPSCDDYSVKVNGFPAELNTARVSACPINRRWPGHQRGIDQSEAVQFLSMETDEPLRFEIKPKNTFDPSELKIRPKSLGIVPEVTDDGIIVFTLEKHAYFTVEPFGRNRALHIFADAVQTVRPDPCGDGVIYFGAGEHDAGTIELHSGETLFIDEGAVVYACIRAVDADNIKIIGRGILDNSRNREKILFEANEENNRTAVNNAVRKHTVQLEYCSNILIDGITIRDSLVYNIRPIGCSDISIRNVKIIGCWRYNSDGIDMHNCLRVHITDCFIRTYDDAVCVKGFDCYYKGDVEQAVYEAMHRNGKVYDEFHDVLVENCVIWNDWGKALEIGAETRAEKIENIIYRKCDVIHVMGAVLDCQNVDYADVNNVLFEDIRIESDELIPPPWYQRSDSEVYEITTEDYMPSVIHVSIEFHHEYSTGGKRRGRNRNIIFHNIRVHGTRTPTVCVYGYDNEHRCENILVSGLYLNEEEITSLPPENLRIGEYTENVKIESDLYKNMAKNTVDSRNQLGNNPCVRFDNPDGKGPRVMFLGNSITLHGILPAVGWFHEWGMAASREENDYVHLLKSEIREICPDAAFCICQAADWEREYKNGSEILCRYSEARDFEADIIVMRIIENCPGKDFDSERFTEELDKLFSFLNPHNKAKLLLTTGFWKHPGDSSVIGYAEKNNFPLITLGDLGEKDEMKALNLFNHPGVANHPGDLGMRTIADRISAVLKDLILSSMK